MTTQTKLKRKANTLPPETKAPGVPVVQRLGEILDRLEVVDRVQSASTVREGSAGMRSVLDGTRLRLMRLLAEANSAIVTDRNIDTGWSAEKRAKSYEKLVREAVKALGGDDDTVKFLVRTAWHEGARLTKRIQDPRPPGKLPGPARSFLQMEAQSAKDAVSRAVTKLWLDELALVSGKTEAAIKNAAAEIPDAPGSPYFPEGNVLGKLLETDDLFGTYLGRIYVTRTSDKFGSTAAEQADFWEKHWHKKINPEAKAQFVTAAKEVDGWFKWT